MYSLVLFDLDGTLIENFLEEVTCPRCRGGGAEVVAARNHPELTAEIACDQCRGKGMWLKQREAGYDEVVWLPGRVARLFEVAPCAHIAIVTNQTGVHWGFQTRKQVETKVGAVIKEIARRCHVEEPLGLACFEPGDWRKPEPGMLLEAMRVYRVPPNQTLMVGDMETDRTAAERAGCAFTWAEDYFTKGKVPA